jgi:xylose isomerase
MGTPGGHYYFGFGGIASPDPNERKKANAFGKNAADLVLGVLSQAEDLNCPIAFDIWNGSFGYEIPDGRIVRSMINWADDGIGELAGYIFQRDHRKKVGVEPKPNEGHSAMIYQTSSDVLALRDRLRLRGLDVSRFGLINEFGHTEMAGLDVVQDYAAADLMKAIMHVHANSQGGDGIRLGGGGKFDIDFGVAPSSTSIGIAQILHDNSYKGWVEHDMQPRAYDNAQQDINRVIRAICNWEAICRTVETFKPLESIPLLAADRRMMEVEDVMRDAVGYAHNLSKELYYVGKAA